MTRPAYATMGTLRQRLQRRVGMGGQVMSTSVQQLFREFLVDAQEMLWRRSELAALFERDVDLYIAPGEAAVEYPDGLDPDRLEELLVDYSGDDDFVAVVPGLNSSTDSDVDTTGWPRRYDFVHDEVALWPTADTARTVQITGISQAPIAIVTAPGHGLAQFQRFRIDDVGGMVEIPDAVYTTSTILTADTFRLSNSAGVEINSSGYTAYTSGGTVSVGYRLRFRGTRLLVNFDDDADRCTLPDDLVYKQALVLAKAHYKHPDVRLHEKDLTRLLMRMRNTKHRTSRYIPGHGRAQAAEMLRPKMV